MPNFATPLSKPFGLIDVGFSFSSPTLADIDRLWQTPISAKLPDRSCMGYLKLFLNYIALGIDAEGSFLRAMQRTQTEAELLGLCDRALLSDSAATLSLVPLCELKN